MRTYNWGAHAPQKQRSLDNLESERLATHRRIHSIEPINRAVIQSNRTQNWVLATPRPFWTVVTIAEAGQNSDLSLSLT